MLYVLRTHTKKKYLFQALASIFGIGENLSLSICKRLGYNKNFRTGNLSEEQVYQINQIVEELALPYKGDLQILKKNEIAHLINIKTYRGSRHRQALPVRGQRTHTNSRTQKRLKYSRKL